MSQIGYMFMGVAVGAYAAGMFHLMTHAFFKALLFIAALKNTGDQVEQPGRVRASGHAHDHVADLGHHRVRNMTRLMSVCARAIVPAISSVVAPMIAPTS